MFTRKSKKRKFFFLKKTTILLIKKYIYCISQNREIVSNRIYRKTKSTEQLSTWMQSVNDSYEIDQNRDYMNQEMIPYDKENLNIHSSSPYNILSIEKMLNANHDNNEPSYCSHVRHGSKTQLMEI